MSPTPRFHAKKPTFVSKLPITETRTHNPSTPSRPIPVACENAFGSCSPARKAWHHLPGPRMRSFHPGASLTHPLTVCVWERVRQDYGTSLRVFFFVFFCEGVHSRIIGLVAKCSSGCPNTSWKGFNRRWLWRWLCQKAGRREGGTKQNTKQVQSEALLAPRVLRGSSRSMQNLDISIKGPLGGSPIFVDWNSSSVFVLVRFSASCLGFCSFALHVWTGCLVWKMLLPWKTSKWQVLAVKSEKTLCVCLCVCMTALRTSCMFTWAIKAPIFL